ncbi:DNA-binding response regulator PetR [alpha proteobacterium BAL199]|nr:DNA-binding response regulator PetR [alpha proteobacterium BAL199]
MPDEAVMAEDLPHILVVDDDHRLRELLRRFLSDNGFRVSAAGDAAEARARMAGVAYDLMVLDVMMPGESGIELTRDLRRRERIPILMLTAMGEAEHRIAGLESGVDDYLAKPFEPRELLLRIRTILRRVGEPSVAQAAAADTEVRFGPFRFDLGQSILWRGDTPVRLTEAEAALLRAFALAPGVTFSREDLVDGSAVNGGIRTVDVQITRLRRKIEPDSKFPRFLQTVRGKGYVLRLES